jgi:mevalonate pyrophosphate decarboxylase
MKTLKQEEIYCNRYSDFSELAAHLEEFLDTYYNRQRLHSALGYRTPEEFEHAATAPESGSALAAATMKFFSPPTGEKSQLGPGDAPSTEVGT